MATFYRIRIFRGHEYLYREERWREKGKMKSRSTCLGRYYGPPGTPRGPAPPRSSSPTTSDAGFGPRPARATVEEWESHKARARQFWLEQDVRRMTSNSFKIRESSYRVSHATGINRAITEYMKLREEVQKEDRELDRAERHPPKGTPTPEEEVLHAQWSANQAAERDELSDEYDHLLTAELESKPDDGSKEG